MAKGLFTSPRVELYLGEYGDTAKDYSTTWETVKLADGTFTTDNSKRDLINLNLSIERNYYSF